MNKFSSKSKGWLFLGIGIFLFGLFLSCEKTNERERPLLNPAKSVGSPKIDPEKNFFGEAEALSFSTIGGRYSSFALGAYHSCGIREDKTLWCWGWNALGQLGDGSSAERAGAVQVLGGNWTAVSAGRAHSCALKGKGTLWCWGDNSLGQLGDGTTIPRLSPTRVGSGDNWALVSAGKAHSCGKKVDGTIWCWGDNSKGQLGDGTTVCRRSPVQVGTGTNWEMISAGGDHTCAKKKDGTLWCWGDNDNGQLGLSGVLRSLQPKKVGTENNWLSVSAGWEHSCAVKNSLDNKRTVWCFGDNKFGQLGNGTNIDRYSPGKIFAPGTNWTSVSAGAFHTCARKANGTLWCWGKNSNGQLGDGTTIDKKVPTRVGIASNWLKVKAGYKTSCALNSKARLKCFGAGAEELKNHPPELVQEFPPVFTDEDTQAYVPSLSSHFLDPDDDLLSFAIYGFESVLAVLNEETIQISAPENWNGTETGLIKTCDWYYCILVPLEVNFLPVNDPPEVFPFDPVVAQEDTKTYVWNFPSHFFDPEDDWLSFGVSGFYVVSVVINGTTLEISAPADWNGSETGLLWACDYEYCISTPLEVKFNPVNDAPLVVQGFAPVVAEEDSQVVVSNVSSHFSDIDGDYLSYSVVGFSWVKAVLVGNSIVISAEPDWNGTETGQVRACDGGSCVSTPLMVSFIPVNDPPYFYAPLASDTVSEDNRYRLDLSAHLTDVDGDLLTILISANPSVGIEFSGGTNQVNLADASTLDDFVSFIPPADFNGSISIIITALDPYSESCLDDFSLEVLPVNDNPVITGIVISNAQELDYLVGQASATDVDSGICGQLVYYQIIPGDTLSNHNVELSLDPVSGAIGSFPRVLPMGSAGFNSLELVVRDGCSGSASALAQFNVASAPDPVPPPIFPLTSEFDPAPAIGTNRVLVILANYADTEPVFAPADFEKLLFSDTRDSMRAYYQKVSYGKLDLTGEVVGWVQLSEARDYYGEGRDSTQYPQNLYKLAEEAIIQAQSQGVDFSLYDNNLDGWVDSLIIVHQGQGTQIFVDPLSLGGSHPLYYDNVKIEYFAMFPEQDSNGNLLQMGYFAHEYGHLLGMMDLYSWYGKNSTTGIAYGVGSYELMAYGVYGGNGSSPSQPIELSPFHRALLGWLEPLAVNSDTTLFIPPLENQPVAIKVPIGPDEREYFLISDHQKLGYDQKLPASGVFIWHIDQASAWQNVWQAPMQGGCTREHKYLHPAVALEQADGLFELDSGTNLGNEGDSWQTGTIFSSSSTPNNYSYDCFPSGVEVKVLSSETAGGQLEIKLNQFQTTNNASSIWLREAKFQPILGKADDDSYPEPGEELELLVRLMNTGILAQGVTLEVGTTSPYLSFGSTVVSPYPNLATGDSAENQERFRLKVNSIGTALEVPAKISLIVRANSGTYSWLKTIDITIGSPAVLLVDDDEGAKAEDVMISALNNLNYAWGAYSFSKWEIAKQGIPSLELLQNHQAVIWICGPVANTPLNSAELNLLKSYLDAGGKLLLSCAYLLVNPEPEVEDFATQYLGLNSWEDNNYSIMFVHGLNQNPVSHTVRAQTSLQTRKLIPVNYFPLVPRNVGLEPSSSALPVFTNELGNPVMVQYAPDQGFGVIYSSFGLEHLDRTVLSFYQEGSLIRRMLNALRYKSGQPIIFDCQPLSAKPRTPSQTLTLIGLNFQPSTEFSFPDGNIQVVSKTYNSPTQYTIVANVLYNAHPGYHRISARNSGQEPALYDRYFKVEGSANPNHKPTAVAEVNPQIGPMGATFTLSGSKSSDPDNEPLTYYWTQLSGPLVSLSPSDTAQLVFFESPIDYIGEYVFSLRVSDGTTLSDADTVWMKAGNYPPVAVLTASPLTGSKYLTYTLDGTQSYDPEDDPLTYFWAQLLGSPVQLLPGATPGIMRFNPALDYIGDYVFELKVYDEHTLSEGDTVRISIINHPPVAIASATPPVGNRNTPLFILSAENSSDPDGDSLSYLWSQLEGPSVVLSAIDQEVVSFQPQPNYMGDYLFSVQVSDGFLTDADTVRITVTNNQPFAVAIAIPPLGNLNTPLFTLSASLSSDPDGDSLSYLWTQFSGPSVLPGATSAIEWSFKPSVDGDYGFLLEVSDGLLSDTASVVIEVTNHAPIALASAEPMIGNRNTTLFSLSGAESYDPDGDPIVSYEWTQLGGPPVILNPSQTSALVEFEPVPDYLGDYLFSLKVSDGVLDGTTLLTVSVVNNPPLAIAIAEPSSGTRQTPFFTLDGSLSTDPDGDSLSYLWTQISGATVDLLPSSTAGTVIFSPRQEFAGDYLFLLEVSDGLLTDSTTVQISVNNNPPSASASASPVSGSRQTVFLLSGSLSSDPDGDPLSYLWTQLEGATVVLTPDNNSPEVSFSPNQNYVGDYLFSLLVSDGLLDDADTIRITVSNHPPVALLPGTTAQGRVGELVILDGSLSNDPDGDPIQYLWTQLYGPIVSLDLSDPSHPTFIPGLVGIYQFQLRVFDGLEYSETAPQIELSITIGNNHLPVADAGPDQIADSRDAVPVCLDGSLSYDPDPGDSISQYLWELLSKPLGSSAVLNGSTTAFPCFFDDVPGNYLFSLRVADQAGVWSFLDQVRVYSQTDDLDGDLMPDAWELANELDPANPADGGLLLGSTTDPDQDGLVNVHEYFNSTDPQFAEAWLLTIKSITNPWEGGFFGDAEGNLQYGSTDVNALSALLSSGDISGYAQVYPPNGETHDLDGDGIITDNDLTVLNELLLGDTTNFSGSPALINLLEPLTGETMIPVGRTGRIMVELTDGYGTPRSGGAVIFEVVKGNASLYGGDGESPAKRLLGEVPGVNFAGSNEFSNCVSQDGLEIFFASNNGRPSYDIFYARRSSLDEPFGLAEPLPQPLNSATWNESGPSLTGDGLYLFFHSLRDPNHVGDIYYAHRLTRDQPFSEVVRVNEINTSVNELYPWISPDGLVIYFSTTRGTNNLNIWKASRNSITEPFSNLQNIMELNTTDQERFPALSADQLEIVFMSNRLTDAGDSTKDNNLWYANRASINDPFSAPIELSYVNIPTGEEWAPFLSPDGLELYYGVNYYSSGGDYNIYLLRRPSRNLLFFINPEPGRFDLTGPITPGLEPNSGGKAFIYVRPNAEGEIKIIISTNRDRKRKLLDLGLDQIITIYPLP